MQALRRDTVPSQSLRFLKEGSTKKLSNKGEVITWKSRFREETYHSENNLLLPDTACRIPFLGSHPRHWYVKEKHKRVRSPSAPSQAQNEIILSPEVGMKNENKHGYVRFAVASCLLLTNSQPRASKRQAPGIRQWLRWHLQW
jgi:hypothetical protein